MTHSSVKTDAPPGRSLPEERAMGNGIKEPAESHELELVSLSQRIHPQLRAANEEAVREKLLAPRSDGVRAAASVG